jgi:hypothetical protein
MEHPRLDMGLTHQAVPTLQGTVTRQQEGMVTPHMATEALLM